MSGGAIANIINEDFSTKNILKKKNLTISKSQVNRILKKIDKEKNKKNILLNRRS